MSKKPLPDDSLSCVQLSRKTHYRLRSYAIKRGMKVWAAAEMAVTAFLRASDGTRERVENFDTPTRE